MGDGLRVDDGADGARWEPALRVLRDGGVTVSIGELELRRDAIGPLADGRVEIAVLATRGPDQLTLQIAQHEVERGRRQFDALCTEDPRLVDLLDEFGSWWNYVYDYGNGSVSLGRIQEGDTIEWDSTLDPLG